MLKPPKEQPPLAVEARSLRKIYRAQGKRPAKEALKGIDLLIPRGSIFGLLGPNGAGKSTFINILAGLVVKTSGTVKVWGHDIDRAPRLARASIGVVPQELNIDPFFTPFESLELQAGLYGVPKPQRRSDDILRLVGLEEQRDVYARTLSGGMRRRLLVAKALVHAPPVLILDEPTAGVDVELRRQLWQAVRTLHAAGTSIILTTHYLQEAEELCDTIAIIDAGEVIALGATQSLVSRVDRKHLLVTPEQPLGAPPSGLEPHEVRLRADGRLQITYAPSRTGMADLLAALARSGVTPKDLSTVEPSLEDAFVDLTSGRRRERAGA